MEFEDEEEVKDRLTEEAKRVLNEQLTSRQRREEASKRGGEGLSREEVDFLKNNRKELDNEELEKVLSGEKFSGWEPFSRTEERYILESVGSSGVEEIASALDREVDELRKKLRMMGMDPESVEK